MAEAIVSTLLNRETAPYKVKDEIKNIRPHLQLIKSVLKDADARQHKDKTIRNCVREIRSLSYRIEDALETYDISVKSWKKKVIKCDISGYLAARRAVVEIRAIKDRIVTLVKGLQGYGEGNLPLKNTLGAAVTECEFFGMDKDVNLLVSIMVEKDKNCQVVSLWGMGGTGKTRLAWELCNHPAIKGHFEGFAWINVGKNFSRRTILKDILRQLVPGDDKGQILLTADIMLAQKINEIQREKKCLVVLDDIWNLDAWESLRVAFPLGSTTSKILLTTRIGEVATVATRKGYIHPMRGLTESDSWELFKRKAFSGAGPDFQVPSVMEEMGREMVRKCGGLPLAIDMLGSFMETKNTLREWEIVHRDLDSYLNDEGRSEIPKVLALSFYDLPYHLKPCFLYLGYFPEESEIEVEKLYLLWMAEGITEKEDTGIEETTMEIADKYLRELELRSLVEVREEEVPTVRRLKSCRLHRLMRPFCWTKSKEDEFVEVIDFGRGSQPESDSFSSDCPLRRLVICLDKYQDGYPVPSILQTAKYLRCLLIFCTYENQQGPALPREISNLSNFIVLKVLDFDGLDFRKIKLPQGISKLIRLRYLSFKGCFLEALPFEIGNLLYLLVLDLRVRPLCKMTVPNLLWKFKKLKHLYLPEAFQTANHDMLRLDGLTKLETLQQFNTNLCKIKDVEEMKNLRYLATRTEGRVEDLEGIISCMNMTARHILRASLDVRNFECYTKERYSVFRQLMFCPVLQRISMEGHIGQIPPYNKISQSLMEIVFSGSELKEDPMQVFGKLPDLRVLVLNDAYLGEEMVCSALSFRELRRLELSNLCYLEKWTIANGALAQLTTLAIENCSRLEPPDGVKFISNLQKPDIRMMPPAFEERLCEIRVTEGEDLDNVSDEMDGTEGEDTEGEDTYNV